MGKNVTDVGQDKKTERRELKKHAATIHCSNTLSLLQRKITNALLYHAYNELLIKEEHEITVKQLCRLIGYQGNNHAAIKEALRSLISTIIEWNVIDDELGTENWTASSIIASVSLEGPICYYAYSPRMKQLLYSPSMFGKIDLVIQSNFRSSYGLALYENCIRYRGLPNTKWFEMSLFKKLMGVPNGKYDIFRDFKRRVLDKAIDEVNTYSDLNITAEYIKEGRKNVRVRFKLKERAKKIRLGNKKAITKGINRELEKKLLEAFGLSMHQIKQLMTTYEESFVQEKIHFIELSKPYQQGKIQNLAGYLLSALKNNYQPPKLISPMIDVEAIKQELELSELKKQVDLIRRQYAKYREKMIHSAIQSLKVSKKEKFMQTFFDFAEPAINIVLQIQRNKYTRENVLDSPQIKAQLRQFALRELEDIVVPTLEEYVAQLGSESQSAWLRLKQLDPEHLLLRDKVE